MLALALAGVALGILVATAVQILHTGKGPEVELSDNATQVLVGATGALTGLIGGYMGSRRPPRPPDTDDDDAGGSAATPGPRVSVRACARCSPTRSPVTGR